MQPEAILFDLGETLVDYYPVRDFQPILRECIDAAVIVAERNYLPVVPTEVVRHRTAQEDHEDGEHRVRPLEDRLRRILFDEVVPAEQVDLLCRAFVGPIFARGRIVSGALEMLSEQRSVGVRLGLISNTPWGSRSTDWLGEVARLGIASSMSSVAFCRDVGWRKPRPDLFRAVAGRLGVSCAACVVVGDNPLADVDGAKRAGMRAILVDRHGRHAAAGLPTIARLAELADAIAAL